MAAKDKKPLHTPQKDRGRARPHPMTGTAPPVQSPLQAFQAKVLHKCQNGYVRAPVEIDGRALSTKTFFSMKPCPVCNPAVRGGAPHTHPPQPLP